MIVVVGGAWLVGWCGLGWVVACSSCFSSCRMTCTCQLNELDTSTSKYGSYFVLLGFSGIGMLKMHWFDAHDQYSLVSTTRLTARSKQQQTWCPWRVECFWIAFRWRVVNLLLKLLLMKRQRDSWTVNYLRSRVPAIRLAARVWCFGLASEPGRPKRWVRIGDKSPPIKSSEDTHKRHTKQL